MYIADLHIHSRYSRATSRECTPEYLDLWARRKGIHIVGTGDRVHKDRHSPHMTDHAAAGCIGISGSDHLVSRSYAQDPQTQFQRSCC